MKIVYLESHYLNSLGHFILKPRNDSKVNQDTIVTIMTMVMRRKEGS